MQSDVIVVADAGEFVFYDCVYEELLQALGPINDTDAVPWTMFNDHVRMGFFDVYDQYLLNVLYHPRVQPGMDIDQVRGLFPEVLADVKGFIAPNTVRAVGVPDAVQRIGRNGHARSAIVRHLCESRVCSARLVLRRPVRPAINPPSDDGRCRPSGRQAARRGSRSRRRRPI